MKILAFAASNNKNSINRTLVEYAASLIEGAEIETLDINDYEMPIFSEDREKEIGQPEKAKAFRAKLASADGLLISYAEHNGHYPAAYKNLFDWASRIEGKVYANKPSVYLSTSPGPGGASSVLSAAKSSAPFFGADVLADVSVPSFHTVFDSEKGEITDVELAQEIKDAVSKLAA